MKKKHGWILEDMDGRKSRGYVTKNLLTKKKLKQARVFATRIRARKSNKLFTDVVRKVSLNKQGKVVKIIPGR